MEQVRIPTALLKNFNDMDFVARVQPNFKLNFSKRGYYNKDSWLVSITRGYYYGESRRTNLTKIREIIETTADNIKAYKSHPTLLDMIYDKMISMIKGFENLKMTYSEDIVFVQDLETLEQSLLLLIPRDIKILRGMIREEEALFF